MPKLLKKIMSFILLYIVLAVSFIVLIYVSFKLPNERIRGHVAESVKQLKDEGIGYIPFFSQEGALLDTHTDALMLNIALNKEMFENEGTLSKAMECSFYEEPSMVEALNTTVQSDDFNNHEYSRYWHGIQVMLRPLLLFFNYTEIRYILMIVITTLLGIAIYVIGKRLGIRYIICFSITISFMYVIIIPMSLQFSAMFIITLLSIISVCIMESMKKEKLLPYLFFVIGALSTYFDLLTYPLVTLGLPLVLTLLLENKKDTKLSSLIIKTIEYGMLWGLGYGTLFVTKWIVASIVLHKNAIEIALDAFVFRVNGNEQYPVTRIEMLKRNFNCFFVPIAKYIMGVAFVIWIGLFAFFRKNISKIKVVLPLLLIAIVPYLWYIIFAGHSSIHFWFTYRIQAVSVFAVLSAMCLTIKENNNKDA
ncbi:MAG: hypothetical protein IKF97_05940 [Clostridia bacterium]|nr:hypothetical protein [Clostridia bacterium]MBR3255727.1 hypothetical protein [Clostridia bacterium]